MHPVRSRALLCAKASTLFGHIKGKGLAKQLCPDTSLLAENWHPHRTPYQLSCLLYSLGWLRSCFFCSRECMHTSCVPFQLSCCRSAISPSATEVVCIWWPEGQMKLRKSIKTPQSSPGILPNGGDLLQTRPFQAFGVISESSAPVRTTSLLSKLKGFVTSASVLWAVSFWLDKIPSQYSCAVSLPRDEQPSCIQCVYHGNMNGKRHLEARTTQNLDSELDWSDWY